jgi:hypothetical protein
MNENICEGACAKRLSIWRGVSHKRPFRSGHLGLAFSAAGTPPRQLRLDLDVALKAIGSSETHRPAHRQFTAVEQRRHTIS